MIVLISARKSLVAVAALGICAGGTACSRYEPEAAARSDAPTVAVAKITRGDVAQDLTIAAEFRPFQEIDVHAKVAGYVKNIGVDVGDRVRTGQLLAVLEVPELQDELRQDQAAVRRAQEEVNRANADLERTQSAHDRPVADGAEARYRQRGLRAAGPGDHRRPDGLGRVDGVHRAGGLPDRVSASGAGGG